MQKKFDSAAWEGESRFPLTKGGMEEAQIIAWMECHAHWVCSMPVGRAHHCPQWYSKPQHIIPRTAEEILTEKTLPTQVF